MKQIVWIRLPHQQETAELMAVVLTVVWYPIQAVLTRVLIKLYGRGDQILKWSAAPADERHSAVNSSTDYNYVRTYHEDSG